MGHSLGSNLSAKLKLQRVGGTLGKGTKNHSFGGLLFFFEVGSLLAINRFEIGTLCNRLLQTLDVFVAQR